jgi:hypothetical protein
MYYDAMYYNYSKASRTLVTIYLCESGFHICYGYLESRDKEYFPVSYIGVAKLT